MHPVAEMVLKECDGDKDRALDALAQLAWGALKTTSHGFLRLSPNSKEVKEDGELQ